MLAEPPEAGTIQEMRSPYFTSKDLAGQAAALLRDLDISSRPIRWDQPALLVLDLQRYFLDEDSHAFVPSGPAILPNILALITAFRQPGLPVVFTRHINTSENAGQMAEWWRDLLTPDHPKAALSPHIAALTEDVLEKSQYDAFYHTDLHQRLQQQGVTDVVITGVMTHLCCETTARAAFIHGYRVWFAIDGTATYNRNYHQASLRNLAHGFAVPVLTDDLLEALA